MTLRDLRRRFRQATARHDWLEGASLVLGLLFLLATLACLWAVGVSIATLGDPDPEFRTTPGFLQASRGFGIVLFGVLAFVLGSVGWFLAGDAVRRLLRRRGA